MFNQTLNEIRELAGLPPLTEGTRLKGEFDPSQKIGVLWYMGSGESSPRITGWKNFGLVMDFLTPEEMEQAGKLPSKGHKDCMGDSVEYAVVYGDKTLKPAEVKELLLAKLKKCIAKKTKFYDAQFL